MKRLVILFVILFMMTFMSAERTYGEEEYDRTMRQDLLCFVMGYPGYILDIEKDSQGLVYVVMKSGKRIIYDDMRDKSISQRLESADLQDTLKEVYPLGAMSVLMDENRDPGRYRCYEFLKEIYGGNRADIEKKLKSVSFVYESLLFNTVNGAATALENTGKTLMPLMNEPRISRAVYPGSGTYNYRVIAGTSHLSPHAYGIAIDLARDSRDYWQWAAREDGQKRISVYPSEVVETFEKNGFIWGGKWWHFDILHFEYRPEILLKAEYFSTPSQGEWYVAVPMDQPDVKNWVEKINNALD